MTPYLFTDLTWMPDPFNKGEVLVIELYLQVGAPSLINNIEVSEEVEEGFHRDGSDVGSVIRKLQVFHSLRLVVLNH